MKLPSLLVRRVQWLNVPSLALLALLQRTPVVRVLAMAENFVMASPVGQVLRSAVAVGAAVELHSLAGATELVPSTPSPAAATVGTPLTLSFGMAGTPSTPETWTVGGTVPTGTTYNGGITTGTVTNATVTLSGTPTTAGTFDLSLRAHDGPTGSSSPVYSYRIVVTGTANTAPSFTTQPVGQTVTVGANVTFTVAATGSPAPTLQWRKDGNAIAGQTGASLALTNVQTTAAGTYTVVATNAAGAVTSDGAVLTVSSPVDPAPTITTPPRGHTMAAGSTVVLEVTATGSNLSYQWKKDNGAIVGATSRLLLLQNVQAAQAGSYTVTVTNGGGSATSSAAVLAVTTTTNPGRIINVSVLTETRPGDQVLIVGFVVGGPDTAGSTDVLVQGLGPRLVPLGVTNVVADPQIQLIPQGTTTILTSNDDWAGNATVNATGAATGATPLTDPASKDSALVTTALPRGPYSVKVIGNNNGSGLALAEVYDSTPNDGGLTKPRLVNVSARAQTSNTSSLTAGFVIIGSTAKTVLIQGLGPLLTSVGLGGALADPRLELILKAAGQAPVTLAVNDDWAGSADVTTVARVVGATPMAELTTAGSKDAALLVTLDPGVYSATVLSPAGASGIALVEVYAVP